MNSRHSYPGKAHSIKYNHLLTYLGEFPDEGWPIEHLSADQLEKGSNFLGHFA